MGKQAYSYKVMFRTGAFRGALGLALGFLTLASCGPTERHRVMTFFFDGVPPLPGQVTDTSRYDVNDTGVTGEGETGGWTVHEPLKDCTQCHANRRRAPFSRKVQLVAEVPQLCFRCHTEFASLSGWVHGPVATGECLFCHEPHKTRTPALLTAPVPELCYRCHDREALALVENHAEASYANCLRCHEGHAAPTRSLLRPAFLQSEAGRAYRAQVYRQQYEAALEQARDDLAQGRDVSAMLDAAADDIAESRLWEARAFLEVIAARSRLSAEEQSRVQAILQQVIGLLETDSPPDNVQAELPAALNAVQQQRSQRQRTLAELYYRSIQSYREGRLTEARTGFAELLRSGDLPEPVRQTAQQYLTEIDRSLGPKQNGQPSVPEP